MSTVIHSDPDHFEGHGDAAAHIPGAHKSALFYVRIALILAVLTAIETSTYWIDFSGFNTVLLIVLMIIKFIMVVSFFMHLRFDNPLFSWLFYAGLILAIGVYLTALATFQFFATS